MFEAYHSIVSVVRGFPLSSRRPSIYPSFPLLPQLSPLSRACLISLSFFLSLTLSLSLSLSLSPCLSVCLSVCLPVRAFFEEELVQLVTRWLGDSMDDRRRPGVLARRDVFTGWNSPHPEAIFSRAYVRVCVCVCVCVSLRLRACAPEREQRRQRPWSVGAVDSTRHTRRHTRKTKARTGVFRLVRFLSLSLSLCLFYSLRVSSVFFQSIIECSDSDSCFGEIEKSKSQVMNGGKLERERQRGKERTRRRERKKKMIDR